MLRPFALFVCAWSLTMTTACASHHEDDDFCDTEPTDLLMRMEPCP